MTTHTEQDNRIDKVQSLKTAGINPFVHSFNKTHMIDDIRNQYSDISRENPTTDVIQTAARLMAKRGHGKALFGNIKDESGSIQFYCNINQVGQELFTMIESTDIGDIIGLSGVPFMTQRGELSIRIDSFTLLTKSIEPLPEKFHGLQDKETRYRKRYVDLIVNDTVKDVFKSRSTIILNIRNFLTSQSFMEVETPVLQSIYGGAAARPFMTHHNELDQSLYLRIALELPLKRLIVGGYENVFEIGRVFRNEGVSYKHNPEYTLLELYKAYADYTDMMALTETLLSTLVKKQTGGYELTYQDQQLNFTPPFTRMSMVDALKHYANVTQFSQDALLKTCRELDIDCEPNAHVGQLIGLIYDKAVEPKLIQPTFIFDYPWETSPLAKRHRDNPDFAERFELIINGMEIANAFTELNDPIDQFDRFKDQERAREAGDQEAHQMDDDFIHALKYGMPPTGGLGIGIDRIVMLLTNQASIRDVLFFPHMKPRPTQSVTD